MTVKAVKKDSVAVSASKQMSFELGGAIGDVVGSKDLLARE